MNDLGKQGKPFLFIIDYEMKQPIVLTLEEVEKQNIYYKINERTNFSFEKKLFEKLLYLEKSPISFSNTNILSILSNVISCGEIAF